MNNELVESRATSTSFAGSSALNSSILGNGENGIGCVSGAMDEMGSCSHPRTSDGVCALFHR